MTYAFIALFLALILSGGTLWFSDLDESSVRDPLWIVLDIWIFSVVGLVLLSLYLALSWLIERIVLVNAFSWPF